MRSHRLHGFMVLLIGLGLVLVLTPPDRSVGTPRPVVNQVITYTPPDPNPYHRQYEEMLYPTVRITSPEGTGSGVVISYKLQVTIPPCGTETLILTAAHVVGNHSEVQVEFFHRKDVHPPEAGKKDAELKGTVVITDTNKDLALITLNSELITPNYSAKLASRDYTPYLFTPVYTIGCSLGLTPRPSQGIISVIEQDHWEITSPILPGNSGGPVFDARTYEVIGIAVWVKTYHGQLVTTMAGIVPIQTVYEFLDKARSEGLSAQQARPLSINPSLPQRHRGHRGVCINLCNPWLQVDGR